MLVRNNIIKLSAIFLLGLPASQAISQSCPVGERYERDSESCIENKGDETIALGVLRHETRRVNDPLEDIILEDDEKGEMELIVTPEMRQVIATSPAESYEVEGLLTPGHPYPVLVVQSLRPIE